MDFSPGSFAQRKCAARQPLQKRVVSDEGVPQAESGGTLVSPEMLIGKRTTIGGTR